MATCGAPAKPGLQFRGTSQATGDAGEDDGEVGGAEGPGQADEVRGADAALKRAGDLLAVVDQFPNEAEEAADGPGCRAGSRRIGGCSRGADLGLTRHERNKSMDG